MITNVYVCVCVRWRVNDSMMKQIVAFSMRIHNGAMRWLNGINESTNESFSEIEMMNATIVNWWRCDINDNDSWTISWFTTNKQVVVHIPTTIVRILAYSDATLFFDMSEVVSLKILGRLFASSSLRFENLRRPRIFSKTVRKTIPLFGISLRPIY